MSSLSSHQVLLLLLLLVSYCFAEDAYLSERDNILLKSGRINRNNIQRLRSRFTNTAALNNLFSNYASEFATEESKFPHLIKFKSSVRITEKFKTGFFAATNVKLLEYIPHNSFTTLCTTSQAASISQQALNDSEYPVEFIIPYHSQYKISGELTAATTVSAVKPLLLSAAMQNRPESIEAEDDSLQSAKKQQKETKAYIDFMARVSSGKEDSEDMNSLPDHERVLVSILLFADSSRKLEETRDIVQVLREALVKKQVQIQHIGAASEEKIVLSIHPRDMQLAVNVVSQYPLVQWIESFNPIAFKENKDARWIMQSNTPSKSPYTAAGLTGKDQVIGVADTGVDVYNCFFYDPEVAPPFIDSTVTTPSAHRKIVGYNTFMDGYDSTSGHGTHVSGTLVGESLYSSPISDYNAIAYKAKLAFFDVGCQQPGGCKCSQLGDICPCNVHHNATCPADGGLYMPLNMNKAYFDSPYQLGARIHSNSIGGDIGKGYTSTSREMDTFIHEHPDFLVFWSAGNSGANIGYMTLTGPMKQFKNGVIVAAGTNSHEAWKDVFENFRDYNERTKVLKRAIQAQGLCSCNTTCFSDLCQQAAQLVDEAACCERFANCTVDHPDQYKNLYANINSGCCKKCVLKALEDPSFAKFTDFQTLAYFSSLGPAVDGRIKPDLVAPGFWTLSANAHFTNASTACTKEQANDVLYNVVEKSGTSMATPTAASTAALVREYFTTGMYPTGEATSANAIQPSAALLKAVMISSARPMTGVARVLDEDGKKEVAMFEDFPEYQRRYFYGYGLVNLANTLPLKSLENSPKVYIVDNRQISTGTEHRYTVHITSGQLAVTLVWTDPPANVGASIALVNDLDLEVTNENNKFLGNAGQTSPNVHDRLNNVEKVLLNNTAAGTYVITITGYNVPMGPQAYALVVSGRGFEASDVEKTFEVLDFTNVTFFKQDIVIKAWLFTLLLGGAVIAIAGLIAALVILVLKHRKKEQYQEVQ